MTLMFKTGERAKFLEQVTALSTVMAAIIQNLSPGDRQKAISKANEIEQFLIASNLESTKIQRLECNGYSFDCAAKMLNREGADEIQITPQDVRHLWYEVTASWHSNDQWTALRMSLCTHLPGTPPDEELAAAAKLASAKSSSEFRSQLKARDAELEARISDPEYWTQIEADMGKRGG